MRVMQIDEVPAQVVHDRLSFPAAPDGGRWAQLSVRYQGRVLALYVYYWTSTQFLAWDVAQRRALGPLVFYEVQHQIERALA